MKKRLFGTDGIRGKANEEPMSASTMIKLGQAIGQYFKLKSTHPKILIGKDTRQSGYMLEQTLSAGICSTGVQTCFLGPIPTPDVAYLTRSLRANAGVMISASHNPFEDNGVKIFSADGYKLPDAIEDEIERLMNDQPQLAEPSAIGTTTRIEDAKGQYSTFLKEQFPKNLNLEGLKIIIDCANGAAHKVAPKVFSELGADLVVLGASPNGKNINLNCGALHTQNLQAQVIAQKADFGFAFDGDADRLVAVDHTGAPLDGDELLVILGIDRLQTNRLPNKTVVTTLMSNKGLELAIQKAGGKILRTQVGDRYVMEAMMAGNLALGGEQSGHIIIHESATTGDGILAALAILEISLRTKKTLHELKKSFVRLPQVLKSTQVDQRVPLEYLPELRLAIANHEELLGDSGRVIFRYSGTESLARIMIEGKDPNQIEDMALDLLHITNNSINSYLRQ